MLSASFSTATGFAALTCFVLEETLASDLVVSLVEEADFDDADFDVLVTVLPIWLKFDFFVCFITFIS